MPGRRRAATGRASGHPAARLRWGPCAPSLSGPRGLARPADAHRSPVVADPLPRRPAAETRGHRARPSGKRRSFPPLAAPVRAGRPESRETHGAARGGCGGAPRAWEAALGPAGARPDSGRPWSHRAAWLGQEGPRRPQPGATEPAAPGASDGEAGLRSGARPRLPSGPGHAPRGVSGPLSRRWKLFAELVPQLRSFCVYLSGRRTRTDRRGLELGPRSTVGGSAASAPPPSGETLGPHQAERAPQTRPCLGRDPFPRSRAHPRHARSRRRARPHAHAPTPSRSSHAPTPHARSHAPTPTRAPADALTHAASRAKPGDADSRPQPRSLLLPRLVARP